MSRTVIINGVRNGYHDILHPDPDPVDKDGKIILALCLLQQADRLDIVRACPNELTPDSLEAFECNGMGVYIKMNGHEVWLRATDLGSEEALFDRVV